jgi:glycosyltransferase involved in cell wall biosynthesis
MQLDSLYEQNERQWRLLIRDDGSTDDTLRIIKDYSVNGTTIQLLDREGADHASTISNFGALMNSAYKAGAEYVFCCDQDDVWEPNKIELMLARLKVIEGKNKAPSLVHHDLAVVDESLEPIADSFVEMMQLQPSDEHNPQRLISRNEVTGCAMACNRALLEIALPISEDAVMHDWWLALCAGYFGRLAYLPEKLVKYRQHGANTIGAKSFWHGLNPFTNWIAGWRRGDEEFISTVKQARAFRAAMSDRLESNPEACATLDLYAGLLAATRWQRLKALRKFNLWRSHWFLNVVLVMRMLLLPRDARF